MRHSTKIPLKAIGVIAGWDANEMHINPQSGVEPSEELCSQLWPWIEVGLDACFWIHEADDWLQAMTVCTLCYFKVLGDALFKMQPPCGSPMWIAHVDCPCEQEKSSNLQGSYFQCQCLERE